MSVSDSTSEAFGRLVARLKHDGQAALDRLRPARRAPPAIDSSIALDGRVGFAVGTGRCGTHFLAELLQLEPEVAASHEREPLIETFHRYCKWNELPVDDEGFLQAMEHRIRGDLARRACSFEASCHLSLSIPELEDRFRPRIVLLVRRPRDVVRSHIEKGWYASPTVQRDPDRALGYQDTGGFHHFLGRIAPRGDAYVDWSKLTQVGKLAWFWTTINQTAIRDGGRLPAERWRVYRLEDFDYATYIELAEFLGYEPQVTRERFDKLRAARPGAHKRMPPRQWTDIENGELERLTGELAARLGY